MALEPYEGWGFRLVIEDRVHDGVRLPAQVWRETLYGLCHAAPPTAMATIAAPSLIVWGDRDELLSRGQQERLAEGIAGSVPAFAEMMNRKARELGLTHSHFANPHGLPDPGQYVSARDLVTLASYLIREFPEQYPLFSEESFTFNGITQRSRNPLLALGADGLKTGHTAEAG